MRPPGNANGVVMQTTRVPGTGLAPTRIGLGTWVMGGWMWSGVADAVATIHAALEHGVTLIDSASVHGTGPRRAAHRSRARREQWAR